MKVKLVAVAAMAALVAGAFEWDFTKGLPEGGKLRACAVLGPEGLSLSQISRNVTGKDGAGVEFPKVDLPEAFVFEAEVVPFVAWTNETDRAAAAGSRSMHVFDTMAVNYKPKCRDKGLQVMFQQSGERWTAVLFAGLGDMTCRATGPSFTPRAGVPVRLKLEYDALGTVRWDLDGQQQESYLAKAGPIVPDPTRRPVVGDRICSLYWPFNGTIRRIAVKPLTCAPLALRPDGRRAFERGETNAAFAVSAFYRGPGDLTDVTCEIDERDPSDGKSYKHMEWKGLLKLEAGKWTEFFVRPLETRLRPGKYPVSVRLAGRTPDGTAVAITNTFDVAIGPVFADRMPAVMWGSSGTDEVVRDFGFTHVLRYGGLSSPECTREQARQLTDMYDRALAAGMRTMHSQGVRYPDGDVEKFFRCRRDGTAPTTAREQKQAEVSNPALVDYARRIVAAETARVGDHPAFAGVLPCSELRDHTSPSFRTEHLRYKAETGRDVPPEVTRKTFNLKDAEARFPDGVVPTDDPIYAYYSWFWGGGDGWPGYTGAIADEYRKTVGRYGDGSAAQKRRPFFSFWDPAVRCPPKWGSGGDVDALNQWVYAQPEPMNVAGPAEEILAMAAGRPGQHPMIMTQLICYRARLAPSNVVVSPLPVWVQKRPRAGFPTIPADALQEAVWSMIAKPVKGIMFHGWGTIAETGSETGYTYTSPESAERLRQLLNGLVAPLGPTLKNLGREEPEVAVLESFATAAMGGPASWGWLSPAITFCQRARLDPRVVYEETILRDGFGRTKILYAPQCRFLSAPVVEKVKAFQKAGGILVADENLLPALKADIVVPVMAYKTPPKSDHAEDVDAATKTMVNTAARRFTANAKKWMLAEAEKLRAALASKCAYAPKADSSSPEIVTYSRAWRGTPYVFALNDKRTFGDYVGQWGLTMEKGLPFAGEVTLADPEGKVGAVYELSRGGEVKFARKTDGRLAVPLNYDTNDGRLLVFLPRKIASVDADVAKAGDALNVTMTVRDAAGEPVQALLPVEVRVYDAAGRELDGAGYACAAGGTCRLSVRTNLNDAPGAYRVVCRDRASGLTYERTTFLANHTPTFYPGAEFPGASGSLLVTNGELRLTFDFSKGGHYVAANFGLPERPTACGVSFEASCPDGAFVTLRVTDATGQTFQQYLDGETESWEKITTRVDAPGGRWGGANDGVFHQPVTGISVLADNLTPDAPNGARGTLCVRNIRFLDRDPAAEFAPARPARTIAQLVDEAHRLRDELARELPDLERRGLGAKTRATVAVIDDFFPWLREDVARGFTNRAHRALWEMVDIGRAGLARLERIRAGQEADAPVPHFVTSPVATSHAQLVATREWPDGRRERGNVILTGFGHFSTVQRELAKLPPLGNHILQMEIGPNSFLPAENVVNTNAIRPFLDAAARGARENVQICLLLSPHYFPAWALRKWPELGGCAGGFFRYCVHDPRARGVLEKSLRTVIPLIRGNPALHSVCLSNEPECGFHGAHCALRGEWPKWLARTYGTPAVMNAAWGTSYASFADVPVPGSFKEGKHTPETLAFIRFNREAFAGFHRWMADVIHSMAPEIPVHSKIMVHALYNRNATYWSVDPEAFAHLSQYNGNDAVDIPSSHTRSGWAHNWWSMEAGYDYQRSCRDVPVFNTENHLIPDREKRSVRGEHIYTALWQNTVHGQGANTLWVWERAYDNGRSDFNGLILERPACLEAWAHCALDLNRLVDRLAPIQNQPPAVLIHWSLASQVLNPTNQCARHFLACYRAANVLGQSLGVATERMLADYGRGGARNRPFDGARVVLLPDASHIPPEVRRGIERLAAEGVAVVEVPEWNDRKMAQRLVELSRGWKLPDCPRVMTPEGEVGPWGVESRGYRANGKSYVTFVNHRARPQRVRLEAPGRDLITGAAMPQVFELASLRPMFVEYATP